MIRTRFAPSPTGDLHLGGARTALFSWAFARRHGGHFVLRIEDTDQERSTAASTQLILEAMNWLELGYDEGPFYQMQRLGRYLEVAERLLETGHAYYCYASRTELDQLRAEQRARGEKPRYDGRWRDTTLTPPAGVKPVLRFKNPHQGQVTFNDLIKGHIAVANTELDDLVLLRADGIPTYNFGVVVDDLDMNITHVIRGDDHVNNTPRQINIMQALGAAVPQFAHVPMILGTDGERLSKRHGADSVLQFREMGYLPAAVINALARLGWSHGDEEVFGRSQLVGWFDLHHISRSPARFNPEKLDWLNQQYLQNCSATELEAWIKPLWQARRIEPGPGDPDPGAVLKLLQGRATRLTDLAESSAFFYHPPRPDPELIRTHLTAAGLQTLASLEQALIHIPTWDAPAISQALKATMSERQIKLPQVAMPARVAVCGTPHTPSLDATFALLGRARVLERLSQAPSWLEQSNPTAHTQPV